MDWFDAALVALAFVVGWAWGGVHSRAYARRVRKGARR
jgi:hypothetical protein